MADQIYQPQTFQFYIVSQLFQANSHSNFHYCKNTVLEIQQISKLQEEQVINVNIRIEKQRNSTKVKSRGKSGYIKSRIEAHDIIYIM